MLDGLFNRPGVHPPEALGFDAGLCRGLVEMLDQRGIHYGVREEKIAAS